MSSVLIFSHYTNYGTTVTNTFFLGVILPFLVTLIFYCLCCLLVTLNLNASYYYCMKAVVNMTLTLFYIDIGRFINAIHNEINSLYFLVAFFGCRLHALGNNIFSPFLIFLNLSLNNFLKFAEMYVKYNIHVVSSCLHVVSKSTLKVRLKQSRKIQYYKYNFCKKLGLQLSNHL